MLWAALNLRRIKTSSSKQISRRDERANHTYIICHVSSRNDALVLMISICPARVVFYQSNIWHFALSEQCSSICMQWKYWSIQSRQTFKLLSVLDLGVTSIFVLIRLRTLKADIRLMIGWSWSVENAKTKWAHTSSIVCTVSISCHNEWASLEEEFWTRCPE